MDFLNFYGMPLASSGVRKYMENKAEEQRVS